jgi:superfamily II DNA helicase RecQ
MPDKPVRSGSPSRSRWRPVGLAAALRELRRREARKRRWRAYQVFDNRTLLAIAEARPATIDALLDIRGLGPKRVARFGERILATVAAHPESAGASSRIAAGS